MKILIIRTTPNKIRLDSYNLQEVGLAKALVKKGHVCDVMYYNGNEKDKIQTIEFEPGKAINIIWKKGFGLFYEGIYPGMSKYVNNYDIIQVTGYVGTVSLWLNTKAQHKTVNYQGPYYYEKNIGDIKKAKVFDRILLPFSNKENMLVISKSTMATDYMKSKGIDNVITVGVGLDTNKFEKKTELNDFIEDIDKNKHNTKYITYIGALEPRRNTLFLIEVFKKISDKMDVKLIIIGKGKSEYVNECMNKIRALGIEEKVIYKNALEQKNIGELYKCSDAFLLPTNYEIFGMVLLEAMYFGVPTFTTYNGGSSTLMNENNGIVLSQLDVDLWANSVIDLLEDETRKKKISKMSQMTIKEHFTWDVIADKFLEIYNIRLKNGLNINIK